MIAAGVAQDDIHGKVVTVNVLAAHQLACIVASVDSISKATRQAASHRTEQLCREGRAAEREISSKRGGTLHISQHGSGTTEARIKAGMVGRSVVELQVKVAIVVLLQAAQQWGYEVKQGGTPPRCMQVCGALAQVSHRALIANVWQGLW